MGPRTKSLLLNLALLAGSTVVALAFAEAAVRLFPDLLPEAAQLRLHWAEIQREEKPTSVPHPYIGFLYPANHRGEVAREDLRFAFTTDQDGFRNSDPRPARADIVTVGDSWVFGYGVDDEQAWPRLVGDNLPAHPVVNLGLVGSSPQQYLRVYQTFGMPLRPRLLVFGLFPGNDVEDARLFEKWLEAGSPGNYDYWRFFGGDVPTMSLTKRSHLMVTLAELWKNRQSSYPGKTITLADGSRLRLAPAVIERNAQRSRPGDPAFERVVQTIQETARLAQSHGTSLLVLLFPTKEAVYLPTVGERSPSPLAPFLPVLDRLGIRYLDLTGPLQERARKGEKLYFEIDGHVNRLGNEVIAETVLAHLRAHAEEYGLAGPAAQAGSASHSW